MNTYEKLRISLRYFLLGKGFYLSADALEFGSEIHTGFRKDKVTPEFQHQIEIAHYLRTLLPSFMYPDETIASALLHDTKEDYGTLLSVIEARFGPRVALACDILDKNGKTPEVYYTGIANNPITSIVKGGDRMHNIQSMVGVFSAEKQAKYIVEVEEHFLPMLKTARRKFVTQEAAYENIKHVLTSQLELLKART